MKLHLLQNVILLLVQFGSFGPLDLTSSSAFFVSLDCNSRFSASFTEVKTALVTDAFSASVRIGCRRWSTSVDEKALTMASAIVSLSIAFRVTGSVGSTPFCCVFSSASRVFVLEVGTFLSSASHSKSD